MNTGSDPKLTQLVDMVEYEAQLAAGQVHLIPAKYTVDLGSLYDLGKPTVQVSAMKGGRPASKSVSTLVMGGSCLMLDEDILSKSDMQSKPLDQTLIVFIATRCHVPPGSCRGEHTARDHGSGPSSRPFWPIVIETRADRLRGKVYLDLDR